MSSSLAMHCSTPEREPVEQGEDREIEGAGQDEELAQSQIPGEEEDRQEQALHEERAEGGGEEHQVRVPRPSVREDRDDGQGEGENGDRGEQDVREEDGIEGRQANHRALERSAALRVPARLL